MNLYLEGIDRGLIKITLVPGATEKTHEKPQDIQSDGRIRAWNLPIWITRPPC